MKGALTPALVTALVGLCACVPGTSRDILEVPLEAAGTELGAFEVGGWTVQLSRAEAVFGPMYFCATRSSDIGQCEAALLEQLDPFVVDALDPAPRPVDTMHGTSGEVRSAFFDYGISWWLTRSSPVIHHTLLDGHSVILEGTATRGDDALAFVAEVDIVPLRRGTVAVLGARTSHGLRDGDVLRVRPDPSEWLAAVDFEALFAESEGSAEPVFATPESQAYQAIVLALTATAAPGFEWLSP